jgi:hypothetical protein
MPGQNRDLLSLVAIERGLKIVLADSTGAKTGDAIDTNLCRDIVLFYDLVNKGAAGTLDIKLTECDTSGGSYSDVANATVAQLTSNGNAAVSFGRLNTKRYIKVVGTVGANAIDAYITVILNRNHTDPNPL